MFETKIRVNRGPGGSIALYIDNDRGGFSGHNIRPEQAEDMARDLMKVIAEVTAERQLDDPWVQ